MSKKLLYRVTRYVRSNKGYVDGIVLICVIAIYLILGIDIDAHDLLELGYPLG